MGEDQLVIEHAVVDESARPRPSAVRDAERRITASERVASAIRQLMNADTDDEVDAILRSSPRLREPEFVGLLVRRARRVENRGEHATGDRLWALACRACGSTDRRVPAAIAAFVDVGRSLNGAGGARITPDPELISAAQEAAGPAVDQLLAAESEKSLAPDIAPGVWRLVTTVAAHAAREIGPLPWLGVAVTGARRSIVWCDAHDPRLLGLLNDLSIYLSRWYRVTPDRVLLTEAVTTAQRVVDLTPVDDPRLATRLSNLSNRLAELHEANGDPAMLDAAIAAARRAVASAPDDLPSLPLLQENLSDLLGSSAMAGIAHPLSMPLTFSPEQRNRIERVAAAQNALAEIPAHDNSARAAKLEELADNLALLFRATGDVMVLDEATARAREALALTDQDDGRWATRAAKLSSRLTEQHRTAGEPESAALAEAVDLCIAVVDRTVSDGALATPRLENLVERVAEAARLDRGSHRLLHAIQSAERLVEDTPIGSSNRDRRQALLATMLVELHRRNRGERGQNAFLEARQLIDRLPPNGPELVDFLRRCRRQLRASESSLRSLDETFDMAETARVAAVDAWLDQMEPVSGAAGSAPSPARSESEPVRVVPGTAHPADRAVRLLQIQIWLLLLVPSGLRIGVLGAIGTPSLLWGLLLFLVWAITSSIPPFDAALPCKPLRWTLAIFWATILFSYALLHRDAVAGDEASNADRYLISLIAFTGIALTTAEGVHTQEQQRRLVRTAVAAVAVMCLIALLQFRPGFDVTVYMERIPGLSTYRSLAASQSRGGFNRPAGTASHPIEYAVVIGCTLALAIHVLLYDRTWSRNRRWLALGLIAFGIPIAVSRSALLVSVPILIVFLIDADRRRRLKAMGVLTFLLVIIFITVPGLIGTLTGFVVAGNSDSSISSRTSDYAAISPYVRAAPWFGRGPGTFLPRLRILDNQYLLSLVETGTVGLVATIGLFSLPMWLGSASRSKMRDPADRHLGRMLLAIGLGIMAAIATFDATSFLMFLLYVAFLLGLAGNHWGRAVTEENRRR